MKFEIEKRNERAVKLPSATFAEWCKTHPGKLKLTIIHFEDGFGARLESTVPWGHKQSIFIVTTGHKVGVSVEEALENLRQATYNQFAQNLRQDVPNPIPQVLGHFTSK